MKPTQKPHELTGEELGQLKGLTRIILRGAKKRGVEMSKRTAKKLARKHMGLVDTDDYNEIQKEFATQNTFLDGVKSALPKYRNF